MTRPDKPISILLYDDKADYAGSFKTTAQKQRIITKWVDNADELFEIIKASPRKYQFVVLDARAYMHEGQAEGTEDEMNLVAILRDLDELKKEYCLTLPYCINTGFADLKLRLSSRVKCPIYEKGNEDQLINHIWEQYLQTDKAILLGSYPEIFEFADNYFDDAAFALLFNLFINKNYFSSSVPLRINNLSALRRTVEHLVDIINDKYLAGAALIHSPGTRLKDILDYLNDHDDVPVHVFSTLTSIRKIAGNFGSHTPTTSAEIKAYPSGELIGGLALALKDSFIWASGLVVG
ncbi:hypothetical protein [Mucilaginibacter aquaedulcis]|uniref:hypothetical protein n=1 Tax=Mucilaginibacter aquaedulcis TaxID=1187081 RepID=UPI0025B4091A|nr:hypothetical protein [Mucilaginibacter aquaedulcis]MDN3551265.1 hypothetical protein [Mucilaginibacter aquaedulcis]